MTFRRLYEKIISKWGDGPLFVHTIENCPYAEGNVTIIYYKLHQHNYSFVYLDDLQHQKKNAEAVGTYKPPYLTTSPTPTPTPTQGEIAVAFVDGVQYAMLDGQIYLVVECE